MTASTTYVSGQVLTAGNMNSLPWGIVDATAGGTSGRGWVQATSFFQVPTSVADVTGMTLTFTPVTGRLYRARFVTRCDNNSTSQTFTAQITNASNTVLNFKELYLIATFSGIMTVETILTGLSGSTTLKARAYASAVGNGYFNAGATSPMQFSIEDIGPST